jgi:hypothetical protein
VTDTGCSCTDNSEYHTSTQVAGEDFVGWTMRFDFDEGEVYQPSNDGFFVRAVRSIR